MLSFCDIRLMVFIVVQSVRIVIGTLSSTSQNVTGSVGSTVSFSCRTLNTSHEFRWTFTNATSRSTTVMYVGIRPSASFNHAKYSVNVDPQNGMSELVVKYVETRDSGTYECTDMAEGKESLRFDLTVSEQNGRQSTAVAVPVCVLIIVVVGTAVGIGVYRKRKGSWPGTRVVAANNMEHAETPVSVSAKTATLSSMATSSSSTAIGKRLSELYAKVRKKNRVPVEPDAFYEPVEVQGAGATVDADPRPGYSKLGGNATEAVLTTVPEYNEDPCPGYSKLGGNVSDATDLTTVPEYNGDAPYSEIDLSL